MKKYIEQPFLGVLIAVIAFGGFLILAFSESKTTTKNNQSAQIISSQVATSTVPNIAPTPIPLAHYIEITDGCGPYHTTGVCVNIRGGAGTEFPVVTKLRTGIVLRVQSKTTKAKDGSLWYKVIQDQELRYPERVTSGWYVAVNPDAIRAFDNVGDMRVPVGDRASTTKRITVNLTEEMLYAYDGDQLFMKEPVSPGLIDTPTPRGKFAVYYKTPSRYMQGPIPGVSEQEYDLPGVPWNLYFTAEGAVIHGAYWHDNFGKKWSHGCVNMSPENAKKLYNWAVLGMPVLVRD
ncbi:MAG: L,D-transpeptidase family protein [Candidatus Paceibacterota bacterium]|jgi:lipoprotein-anchoring transpeptidase ErfK/SrfK